MRPRQKFPYHEWEDYQAGMFGVEWAGSIEQAVSLLRDGAQLERAMSRAVAEWPKAAAHHLTDDGLNQQAWLGWAACGIAYAVPAHVTRAAWWLLSDQERGLANAAADRVLADYQRGATLFTEDS